MSELSEAPAPPPRAPVPSPGAAEPALEAQYRAASSAFRGPHHRPLLGPSLVSYGTILCAYVVLGDLVLAFGLPEGLAVVALLGTIAWSAHASGHRSVALSPPASGDLRRRLALPGLAGLGATLMTVVLVSVFAHASRVRSDSPVTLFLLSIALTAAALGYHLSGPSLARPTVASRALLIGARVAGSLLTVVVVARALVTWR